MRGSELNKGTIIWAFPCVHFISSNNMNTVNNGNPVNELVPIGPCSLVILLLLLSVVCCVQFVHERTQPQQDGGEGKRTRGKRTNGTQCVRSLLHTVFHCSLP